MRKRIWAAMLALLLLGGCGAGDPEPTPSPYPTVSPTAAPTPAPTPAAPAAPVVLPADDNIIHDSLENAWYQGEAEREAFEATGSGDISALHGNTLFVIRKKRVGVYHLEGGGFYKLDPIDVGFYWIENRDENGWTGCEKTPLELFVSGERLAVVSAWTEYAETYTDGVRSFADHSRTVLDIFDVSDPASPVPVASYGQDGGQCAGYADDEGHLWLLSRRSVYEADYATPAVHNSEHRIELEMDHIDVQSDGGRAQMVVLGLYDLTDGIRWDARAFIGGGERALLGADGAYIIGGREDAALIHYAVNTESIKAPRCMVVEGALLDAALTEDALYLASEAQNQVNFTALSPSLETLWQREMLAEPVDWGFGADCFRLVTAARLQLMNLSDRSLREGELSALRAERLDEKHWITVNYSLSGTNMELVLLRAGAKGTLKEATGLLLDYSYRPAAEEMRGLWLSEELLALGSETGCSLYCCGSDGFVHQQNVLTSDNSAHMRYYILEDYLYVADTREVHALHLDDLRFVGEWFL